MKVKIGDRVYDPNDVPIMIILTDADKDNIAQMPPNYHKYCSYPDEGYGEEEIKKWMAEE